MMNNYVAAMLDDLHFKPGDLFTALCFSLLIIPPDKKNRLTYVAPSKEGLNVKCLDLDFRINM